MIPPRRRDRRALLFRFCIAIGFALTLFGAGLELLPGTSPGLGAPQLTLILGGIAIVAAAIVSRTGILRRSLGKSTPANLTLAIGITLVTLLALELALSAINLPTWFPRDVPDTFLQPVPWWTCDAAGCHYVQEHIITACDRGELGGRRCLINAQGFHDTQEFAASPALDSARRILVLGDSFAFGGSAEIGNSFVETLEARFDSAIIWNTAIPGAGTNQAIASHQAFAPIMQPHLTLVAFYMNDFDDNMLPVDSYFMGVDSTGKQLSVRQYQVDAAGAPVLLNQQSDLYYRFHRVEPPANAFHQALGETRLGTLLLRFVDAVGQMLSKVDGGPLRQQTAVTRDHLRQLRDLTAASGSELLALLIPTKHDVTAPSPRFQAAVALFAELDIKTLNPIDALESAQDYPAGADIHWTNAGHQKAGAMLIRCLEAWFDGAPLSDCQSLVSP